MDEKAIRTQLQKLLTTSEAHVDWKEALEDMPQKMRGAKPQGAPHTPWELLEHARIAQRDILEFSRNPKHVSPDFPAGYWPNTAAPPDDSAWDKSVRAFEKDREAMGKLVGDSKTDLFGKIPHATGQTIFREALLLADHNAYHLGQFVLLRRMLGAWNET
jgi:DinB superfamily